MAGYKAPPVMRDGLPYDDWKKELQIWQAFTDLDKKRQGGALFLTLTGKAREAVLGEIEVDKVNKDNGVDTIVKALDDLYEIDKADSSFQAFDNFIKFRRPASMKIEDYLLDFNTRYNKVKCYGMTLPEGVLAYSLLTCCNLTQQQEQICRTTCKELNYKDMKQQIERIGIINQPSCGVVEPMQLVTQPQYQYAQYQEYPEEEYGEEEEHHCDPEEEEAYYSYPGRRGNYNPRPYRPPPPSGNFNSHNKQLNPPDEFGKPSSCRFCRSVYHWVDKCPDAPNNYRGRGRGPRRTARGGYRGEYRGEYRGGGQRQF